MVLSGFITFHFSNANIAGLSGADEPSHFLNGVFVSTYLKIHLLTNPMAYAVDYYLHYPKISIGHWPPAYYGLLGVLFLVVPPTPENAFLINIFVSALPAVAVATALACIGGVLVALAGVAIYMLTPLVLEGFNFFMLDQALAALAVAATAAWIAYADRQTWVRAFAFAGLFTAAVLVKGNGWLLVFVPPYYLVLTGSWRTLVSPAIYVALLAAAGIVLPWYWFTSGIAADGFNYHAGTAYALMALKENISMLAAEVTWVALPLTVVAVILKYRQRHYAPLHWQIVCGCLSLILSTLTLQSLVPVDIVDRYMAPVLPALIVLALVGVHGLNTYLLALKINRRWGTPILVLLAASMLVPGAIHLAGRNQKVDFRLHETGLFLTKSHDNKIYLIDGAPGAEGAFIAEMAVLDPALKSYVVRSSKLLAASNFMGADYRLIFSNPVQILQKL